MGVLSGGDGGGIQASAGHDHHHHQHHLFVLYGPVSVANTTALVVVAQCSLKLLPRQCGFYPSASDSNRIRPLLCRHVVISRCDGSCPVHGRSRETRICSGNEVCLRRHT